MLEPEGRGAGISENVTDIHFFVRRLELSPIEVTHIVECVENDHHRQSADINQKRLLPPPPLLSVIMN